MTLAVLQKSCLQSCHVSVHLLMMASFVSRIETAVQTIHVLQVKIMRNRYGLPKSIILFLIHFALNYILNMQTIFF